MKLPGPDPAATLGSLAGLYDGYEAYRRTEPEELDQVVQFGIVALDTNVLLDLYRYAKRSREESIKALEAIAPRLFMPAQVQEEFWRNRDQVIREIVRRNPLAGVRDAKRSALAALSDWGRNTMSDDDVDALKKEMEATFNQVLAKMQPSGQGLHLRAALSDVKADAVLGHLEVLFGGRVGRPFDKDRLVELVAEGRARFARRIPPGYMDADKADQSEEGTGDFLIWEQLIAQAKEARKDIVFVTRDLKEDWWRLDAVNSPIGPRVELVNEMRDRAGVRFLLAAPGDLWDVVSEKFKDVPMSQSTVNDAEQLSEDADVDVLLPWSPGMWEVLLARLEESGYPVRVAVLREAAGDPDGFIPRQRVYELGEYDSGRLLVGFTRPIAGATRDLIASGDLPAGLEPALRAQYLKPGKAEGFVVPRSVVAATAHEVS
ncbi:PIN-like domain-containing protein [Micromonospora zamorensis]|uniref:PIN-like domain-containing protein n=1 Tax=Micromonospora zamorensis TaxID=709883 RepID=UPI0033E109E4